jgi:hypothetical protein
MFVALFAAVVGLLVVLERVTRPTDDRPTWHKKNPS